MPTSVRLDRATQLKLERLARRTGRSKSSLMREAIGALHERLDAGGAAIGDQLADYIGAADLGTDVTGRRAKQLLADGFGRKRRP